MVLDHIENIQIFDGITPLANYHSILQLKEGIFLTYNNMRNIHDNYYEIAYPHKTDEQREILKKSSLHFSGELNRADAIGMNLFHWYSINLMNFAKSCGLIKFLNETGAQPERFVTDRDLVMKLREHQKLYISSISELEPVKHFRDKASAHLAYTDPFNDNAGTLVESMSLLPVYKLNKLVIGSLKRGKGADMSSFGKYEWNLVDNFKSLIPRYFKNDFGEQGYDESNP